ncbi:hypothetical protein ACH5RR_001152 [Cinchona calisaya]|uniref:Uncharacterized protein n=1 Tax=Cinchona calisaya TaxID=153742 RepID=A0ABD3B365_9GENT
MCSKSSKLSTDTRSGGNGCLLWFGYLMDMKIMHEVGEDIYIRMASSESEHPTYYASRKSPSSYKVESNATVLSTNWKEVGLKKKFVGLALEEAYPENQQNLCAALIFLSLIMMTMYNVISIDGSAISKG